MINEQEIIQNAQMEGIQIVKSLLAKYPSDQPGTSALLLQTLENALTLILVGTEKSIKPKELMRIFSQNVIRKVRFMKENIKDMDTKEQPQTKHHESQLDQ